LSEKSVKKIHRVLIYAARIIGDDGAAGHQGRRVVVGQRLTQGSPDIFLGWGRADERDFYVRQLSELKGGAALVSLDTLPGYCGMCGWALALSHAKAGDAATIAGYCGRSYALDEAIGKFAMSYEADRAGLRSVLGLQLAERRRLLELQTDVQSDAGKKDAD